MSRTCRSTAVAVALALALFVPVGPAQAAPAAASPADNLFTFTGLFDQVLAWLGAWGGRPPAREGGMIDPNGGQGRPPAGAAGAEKEGTMIDPDGHPGPTAAGAACGDAGTMIDPNGGPCNQ